MIYLKLVSSFFVKFFAAWLLKLKLNRAFCFFLFWSDMMSILDVVQSQSHSILSINYRLQIIELIKTTEFELKHGFGIGFRHIKLIYHRKQSAYHRLYEIGRKHFLLPNHLHMCGRLSSAAWSSESEPEWFSTSWCWKCVSADILYCWDLMEII